MGTLTEGSTGGKLAPAREYDEGKLTLPSARGAKKTGNRIVVTGDTWKGESKVSGGKLATAREYNDGKRLPRVPWGTGRREKKILRSVNSMNTVKKKSH